MRRYFPMQLAAVTSAILMMIPTALFAQETQPQSSSVPAPTAIRQMISTAPIAPQLIALQEATAPPPAAAEPGEATSEPAAASDASSQSGQTQPKENPPEPESHGTRVRWQDLPRNIVHDQKLIWTSPLHINRDNAKWWLLFGGATAGLIAVDRRASDALPNTQTQLNAGKWASRFGADYFIYPLTATFYFVGKAGDNPRARDTARLGIEALADAEISVNIMKFATQRPRPTDGDGHGKFWDGGDSFPSGHAIKTWALARVISREFSDNKFVPYISYGIATMVPFARFAARKHFASDTLVGAAMGWFIGDMVYRHHHAPSERSRLAVVSWLATHTDISFGSTIQNPVAARR